MVRSDTVQRAMPVRENFRSYWILFALSFAVFLAIALVGQLSGRSWRSWLPGAEGVSSMFGGVKAAVYTFMAQII
jgi:light-harvesting complex 1 beta chain